MEFIEVAYKCVCVCVCVCDKAMDSVLDPTDSPAVSSVTDDITACTVVQAVIYPPILHLASSEQ